MAIRSLASGKMVSLRERWKYTIGMEFILSNCLKYIEDSIKTVSK
jgi:hypothetical protein